MMCFLLYSGTGSAGRGCCATRSAAAVAVALHRIWSNVAVQDALFSTILADV